MASRPPRTAAQIRQGREGFHLSIRSCGAALLAKPSSAVPQTVRPALLRRIFVTPRKYKTGD